MKNNICFALIAIFFFTSCKKENSVSQNTTPRLCNQWNDLYKDYVGNDSAICYMANSFTPNGDGDNDIYYVRAYNIQSATMMIKDSGNVVFTSNSIAVGWTGEAGGVKAAEKNYQFSVTGTTIFGNSFNIDGEVSLIRYRGTQDTIHAYKVNCDTCTSGSQWSGEAYVPSFPLNELFDSDAWITCD